MSYTNGINIQFRNSRVLIKNYFWEASIAGMPQNPRWDGDSFLLLKENYLLKKKSKLLGMY